MSSPSSSASPVSSAKPSPLLHLGYPEEPGRTGSHIPFYDPPDYPSEAPQHKRIIIFALLAAPVAFVGQIFEHLGSTAITPMVALPWVIPFVVLLACIAIMPFVARHFWEKHYHHVSLVLAGLVCAYYLLFLKPPGAAGNFFDQHAGRSLARSFGDYISFIFLLGSLFTISGGILIRVRRQATPTVNALLLLGGAMLANVFGTTGAAMLLIRPYLRINKNHIRPFHVVFFILLIANVGGCLTPIGDPPLFLGYLRGVPFWWVLEKCWPMWALAVAILLAIFLVLDIRAARGQPREPEDPHDLGPAVSIYGASNLLLVFAVIAGVLIHEPFNDWLAGMHRSHVPLRELIMTAAISISLWTTPRRIHVENVFNFAPIREVAFLFIGIFATMVPALNYLASHAADPGLKDALRTPGQFYLASGALSSVLDNAPTYVTFLGTELSKLDPDEITFIQSVIQDPEKDRPAQADVERYLDAHAAGYDTPEKKHDFQKRMNAVCEALIRYHGEDVKSGNLRDPSKIRVGFLLGDERLEWYIIAISLGSVFFGAMTYIGNGPNFMVKSIAENAGVKCPSFFGYIFAFSVPILLPVLILVWALFLRPQAGG